MLENVLSLQIHILSAYIDYWMSLIHSQDLEGTEKYGNESADMTKRPGVIIVCTHKDVSFSV